LYSSTYSGSRNRLRIILFAPAHIEQRTRASSADSMPARPCAGLKLIDYLTEPSPALVRSSIDLLACFQHPQHPIVLASLIAGWYEREESRLLWPSTVCAFRQPDGDEVSHYETGPGALGRTRLSMLSTQRILLYALYLVRFQYTYAERRDDQSAAQSAV
jgi:hypothetical protein